MMTIEDKKKIRIIEKAGLLSIKEDKKLLEELSKR